MPLQQVLWIYVTEQHVVKARAIIMTKVKTFKFQLMFLYLISLCLIISCSNDSTQIPKTDTNQTQSVVPATTTAQPNGQGSTATQIDKSETKAGDKTSDQAELPTSEPAEETPPLPTITPTVVESKEKQEVEVAAISAPFPFNIPNELDFSKSRDLTSFSDQHISEFSEALKINFEQSPLKAGINIAVFDGKSLWEDALGIASAEQKMTTATPMIIRSTSKTFLGALVVSQIEQGLYKFNDTVESLLSDHQDYALIDIPNVNTSVTVEQLLTMTSGLDDWSEQSDFSSRLAIMMDREWKPANNLSKIPTKFVEPGNYYYSYANSILLGLIATHKDGRNLNEIYQELFFEPLGIEGGLLPEISMPLATAVPYDDLSLYQAGEGFGPLNEGMMSQFYGRDPMISWAGAGIISTPENIARWGYELFSPLGSAIPNKTRETLISGMTIPTDPGMSSMGMDTYGYYMGSGNVSLRNGEKLKVYTHPGGGGGRTSWLYYSPELDVSISLLANSHILHEPGKCGFRGYDYMPIAQCIAGSIFSTIMDN